MREIKFRGKAVNGGWVYGYYCVRNGRHYIQSEDVWTVVEQITLGEFIGIQDQNGVDMYTGDIVNTGNEAWHGNYEIGFHPKELLF